MKIAEELETRMACTVRVGIEGFVQLTYPGHSESLGVREQLLFLMKW